jgi:hypothetical protein
MANAVTKVPRCLHAAAKRPLKLAGADAFLAGAKQVDSLKPKPQGKVAVLKDRSDANRERLATLVALAQANASRLALKATDPRGVGIAAVWASRTMRPKLRFDVSECRFLIVKSRFGKNRLGHGLISSTENLDTAYGYVK